MTSYYGYSAGIGDHLLSGFSGFMSVFLFLYYFIVYGAALAMYIIEAMSLYTIAKRRGIHHAWLAWIPIGNAWLLGSISDQYQLVAKNEVRTRRKVLLGLSLSTVATTLLVWVFFSISFLTSAANIHLGSFNIGSFFYGASFAIMLLCSVAALIIAIVQTVFQYVAYFDVYASCNPRNAVLDLIFSIIFPVVIPFMLLSCRKKDHGMPARVQQEEAPDEPEILSPAVAAATAMAEAAAEEKAAEEAAPAEETSTPVEEAAPAKEAPPAEESPAGEAE